MAFSLRAFEAFPGALEGAQSRRATQHVVLHIEALAADVDLDIGDDDGTFWVAAKADTAFGAVATTAHAELLTLLAQVAYRTRLYSPTIEAGHIRGASTSAGVYTLGIENNLPNITFDAADGLLIHTVALEYILLPNVMPTTFTINAIG